MANVIKACYHITGGPRTEDLHFVSAEELAAYKREEKSLKERYVKLLRQRYGVWAPNQGGYVKDESQLNSVDRYLLGMSSKLGE